MEDLTPVEKPTNPKFMDYEGMRIGHLFVRAYIGKSAAGRHRWFCICDCGRGCTRFSRNLSHVSKSLVSCGCKKAAHNRTHGYSSDSADEGGRRTYRIWMAMRSRCNNPKNVRFEKYGGRGIAVCERWNNFNLFLTDMGKCPDGLSIDRYPNKDGDYEPGNCRWATKYEQARNTSYTKLDEDLVKHLRKLVSGGSSVKEAHRSLSIDVSYPAVYNAVKGYTWADVQSQQEEK